jgi:hypothetical protein
VRCRGGVVGLRNAWIVTNQTCFVVWRCEAALPFVHTSAFGKRLYGRCGYLCNFFSTLSGFEVKVVHTNQRLA